MSQVDSQKSSRGTTQHYVAGFVLSLVLTLTAYFSVQHHIHTGHVFPTDNMMVAILSGLALAQLLAQLVFFFHLNRQSRPKWNLLVFGFMLIVVIILVAGSLWIMHNLNYSMSPQQMNKYLLNQESGGI